jgi:hypothetical protein
MNNTDDILKRILLNMKYDPRKTLNENKEKVLLKEETCPEIRQQIMTNLDQDTYMIVGQLRSRKYPKWGSWGDGSCICDKYNPAEGYKEMCNLNTGFSKKCCKNGKSSTKQKATVSVDDITQSTEKENATQMGVEFYDETAYDGTPMKLPTTVQNVKKTQCGNSRFYYSDEPIKFENHTKIKNACTFLRDKNMLSNLKFNTYEDCLSTYGNKLLSFCNDDAVLSFEYEGLKYRPCFAGIGSAPNYKPVDNMFFNGYFGSDPMSKNTQQKNGECDGIKWNSSTGKSEKNEDPKNVNQFDTQKDQTGIEGGTGSDDYTTSFIF